MEFDLIETQVGEHKRSILVNSFVALLAKINHAIDHIKKDHLDDR